MKSVKVPISISKGLLVILAVMFLLAGIMSIEYKPHNPPWPLAKKYENAVDRELTQPEIQELLGALEYYRSLYKHRIITLHLVIHADENQVYQELILKSESCRDPGIKMIIDFVLFKGGNEPETRLRSILDSLTSEELWILRTGVPIVTEQFEPEDSAYASEFITRFEDEESRIDVILTEIIGKFPDHPDVIPFLIEQVNGINGNERDSAIDALGYIGREFPELRGDERIVNCLENQWDCEINPGIREALYGHMTEEEYLSTMRDNLKNSSTPFVRASAAYSLMKKAPGNDLPDLFQIATSDSEASVREAAYRGLAQRWPVVSNILSKWKIIGLAIAMILFVFLLIRYRASVKRIQSQTDL